MGNACRPCFFFTRNHLYDQNWFVPFTSSKNVAAMQLKFALGARFNANDGGTYLPAIRAADPVIASDPILGPMIRSNCVTPEK